jgi:hypothetical protein
MGRQIAPVAPIGLVVPVLPVEPVAPVRPCGAPSGERTLAREGPDMMRAARISATVFVLLGMLAPAAGAAGVAAPPGGPGSGRCPAGLLCVWTGPGFTGAMTEFLDDPNWAGQCRLMRKPVRSVANLTAAAPWRLQLFLFHNPRSRPCNRHGVYAQYLPGQSDPAVAGGTVTAVQVYAEPNTGQ